LDDPSFLLQEYKKRNLLGTFEHFLMGGMFCITHGVEVSMYTWVYVISIMRAWKDSTKGHNDLENSMSHKQAYVKGLYFDIDI
jgi:hypothetical protein